MNMNDVMPHIDKLLELHAHTQSDVDCRPGGDHMELLSAIRVLQLPAWMKAST